MGRGSSYPLFSTLVLRFIRLVVEKSPPSFWWWSSCDLGRILFLKQLSSQPMIVPKQDRHAINPIANPLPMLLKFGNCLKNTSKDFHPLQIRDSGQTAIRLAQGRHLLIDLTQTNPIFLRGNSHLYFPFSV